MKTPSLIVRIPEPCHEDWNKMTPADQGRFCGSCCKTVIDFSNKSDLEIRNILLENKDQKMCGHFRKSQVNRPLTLNLDLSRIPSGLSLARAFALSLLLVFGGMLVSCYDHNGKKIEKIEITGPEGSVPLQKTERILGEVPAGELKGQVVKGTDTQVEEVSCGEQRFMAGAIAYTEIQGDVAYEESTVDGGLSIEEYTVSPEKPEEKEEVRIKESEKISYVKGKMVARHYEESGQTEDAPEKENVLPQKNFLHAGEELMRGELELRQISSPESKLPEEETEQMIVNKENEVNTVQENIREASFQVFPNPSNGELTVKYDLLKRSNVRIDVFNELGSLVKTMVNVNGQYEGRYQIPLQLHDLPNGVYLVSLQSGKGRMTKRVILER